MSSEGPRGTKCDHSSRDSATILDPDAKFGGRKARKKLWTRLLFRLDPHVHPYCHYILNYMSCTRQTGFRRVFRNSVQINGNNAALIENSQRVGTGVGDAPMNLLYNAVRLRGFEEDEPIRHNPTCSVRRIHRHAGSFVRPLFLISVRPSTNFCTLRDRNVFLNHTKKPSIYLPFARPFGGPISVLTGVTRDFIGAFFSVLLLVYLRIRVFPSEFSLANFPYAFSQNGRGVLRPWLHPLSRGRSSPCSWRDNKLTPAHRRSDTTGEAFPHDYFIVHRAGRIRGCVLYRERRCTVHFVVSGIDSLL